MVSKITFDKTGTLTYGMPQVAAVRSADSRYTKEELYRFCAAAEHLSEHPLGESGGEQL